MHGNTISWAITAGSLIICELQPLQHVISVTCQKSLGYQWPQRNHGETRPTADGVTVGPPLLHGHTAARLPWLSYSPSLTLLGKESTPFSPRNNSFRFYSHPHPFQMLEDWYQCDSSHPAGKAAQDNSILTVTRFVTGNHVDKATTDPGNTPFTGSHWNNLSSFLEKIAQA